jgi:hypothetical protein
MHSIWRRNVSIAKRTLVVAIGATAVALGGAAPANAEPGGDDSCPRAMAFLCHFLPVAPGLDHDIDLTQNPATINGDTLPQMPGSTADTESGPPRSP